MSPPRLNSPEEEESVHYDNNSQVWAVLSSVLPDSTDAGTSQTLFGRAEVTFKSIPRSWGTKVDAVKKIAMKHSQLLKHIAFAVLVGLNVGLLLKSGFHATKATDFDPVGTLARIEKEHQETHLKLQHEILQQEQIIKSANDRIAFLEQQMDSIPALEVKEVEPDEPPPPVSCLEKVTADMRDSLGTFARATEMVYYRSDKVEAAEALATEIQSFLEVFDTCSDTYENLTNEAEQWKTETVKLVRRVETLKQQKRFFHMVVTLNALVCVAAWWAFALKKKKVL